MISSAFAGVWLAVITGYCAVHGQVTVDVVPSYESLEEDDFAHFECIVQPTDTNVQRIRWTRADGKRLPVGRHFYFDAERSDLIIEPLWLVDSGIYRCEVTTSGGVVTGTAELSVIPYQASAPCSSNPCRNDGRCIENDLGTLYRCDCTPDFEGENCARRRTTNVQFYPCQSSPCNNGGLCQNVGSDGFECDCAVGFTGRLCAQEIGACVSQPCANNGRCLNHQGGFDCQCDFGYQGPTCEEIEDYCYSSPCLNSGRCFPAPGRFECACSGGWGGERCEEDVNGCLPDPCSGHGNCTDLLGGYSCACREGYQGPHCENDINECASDPCQNTARCINTDGGFLCQCRLGYEGVLCQSNINECASNPCENGGTCLDGIAGFRCQCHRGNVGRRCEQGPPPSGICLPTTCQNGGSCTDTEDGYVCACPTGTYGPECQHIGDICSSSPCSDQGSCVAMPTGYKCECKPGRTGRRCQIEINECDSSPCLNGGVCLDQANFYTCVCSGTFAGRHCEMDTSATEAPTALPTAPSVDATAVPSLGTPLASPVPATSDPCESNPCANGACTRGPGETGSFACACERGFSGSRCNEITVQLPRASTDQNFRITVLSYPDWEMITRQDVASRSFPVTLTGLPPGSYTVRIDGTDDGVRFHTVGFSSHGNQESFVPAWSTEVFSIGDSDAGVSLQLNFPQIPLDQGTSYVSWVAEYRTVASLTWQRQTFPVSQSEGSISGLSPGSYVVRVHATGPRTVSPPSPEVHFDVTDFCQTSPCSNSGTCSSGAATFQCACQSGYTGSRCQQNVDECLSLPCMNGARCVDDVNSFSCDCPAGYEGDRCQTDSDDCSSQPCQNGGACQDAVAGYRCICAAGYQGEQCREDVPECLSSPCQNGGRCVDEVNAFRCECRQGFSGNRCEQDIDECASSPCQHESRCSDGVASYTCSCVSGFTGQNCDQEVNACEMPSPCHDGQCRHLGRGNFECVCDHGYTGRTCSEVVDFCQPQPCLNGATCTSTRTVGYTCGCDAGYRGQNCAEADIDHCASQPCQNGGTCSSSEDGYRCRCAAGYTGTDCQEADVKPCDSSPCQNGGACDNAGADYRCRCRGGFEGKDCSQHVISGACASGPCLNGGRCYGRGSRYRCYCRTGFRGRNCEQESCRVPGEVFESCASSCPPTCDQPVSKCEPACVPSCQCDIGLVYGNSSKLTCIRPSQCPNPTISPKYSILKPGTGSFLVCGGNLNLEDISAVKWSRADGEELAPGRHHLFTRKTNLYIDNHVVNDTGDYVCTVFTGLLSQTATAHIEVTDVKASVTPSNRRMERGESVDMECTVSPASATVNRVNWRRADGRYFSSGRTKFSDDRRTLSIDSLRRSDSAEYICSVDTSLGVAEGRTSFVVGEKGCIADGKMMAEEDTRYVFSQKTVRDTKPAADIIFLVDESRSMQAEHAWLANVSLALDTSLVTNGIGIDLPNQFGMIGFAKDDPKDIRGRVITMPDGDWMGTATEFNSVRTKLALNGRSEDMYTAIQLALDYYPLRPGMACQIIGVTDEGRTPLPLADGSPPLDREDIRVKLKARGCFLNVIINEQLKSFEPDGTVDALGVTGNNDSTVEMPGGEFRIMRGFGAAVPRSAHGTTHSAYTQLAFSTGGAAWDLNHLRVGGETAEAFTKAFVWLKEREISQQLCSRCRCEGGAAAICIPGCLSEPPTVIYSVSSSGHGGTLKAVNEGGLAEFTCESDGEPLPEFTWQQANGDSLPPDSRVTRNGAQSILQVPNVRSRLCVECIAENAGGSLRRTQCLDSLGKCAIPGRNIDVLHGDSVRNYSTHRGDDVIRLPSSAVVVLVVDESGSMVGEHLWLNTTVVALEENLKAKGVGVLRPNSYALVGFASPTSVTGRIIPLGGGGGHCGTATEMSGALGQLQVDGQLEDGYAAMTMALNEISCLQDERANQTACQVILITDEGRDRLKHDIQYQQMLDTLSRQDCILNVVVWERFRGRELASPTVSRPRWKSALGIDRHNRAVIAQGSDFAFLPEGNAWAITGRENTHLSYVQLATQTGGGAWDLEKLRTEQYREAFTNGFISAKVEEIQQQIFGRCEDCLCNKGTMECRSVEGVSTRQRCISPPSNRLLGIVILPVTDFTTDGESYAKFQCSVIMEGKEESTDPITVTWVSHPIQAVVDLDKSELQFSNVTASDEGTYTCQARNAGGYNEASIDLNIASQGSSPLAG